MERDIFAGTPGVYTYADTSLGKTAEGVLAAGKGERNVYDQRTVGGKHRGREDDGSHLIASRFLGSGRKFNLISVHRNLNRGSYKRMENRLAKLLSEKNNIVHMKVAAAQRTGIERPDVIMATNALKDRHGRVDVENLSFQNMSHKEQAECTGYPRGYPAERGAHCRTGCFIGSVWASIYGNAAGYSGVYGQRRRIDEQGSGFGFSCQFEGRRAQPG